MPRLQASSTSPWTAPAAPAPAACRAQACAPRPSCPGLSRPGRRPCRTRPGRSQPETAPGRRRESPHRALRRRGEQQRAAPACPTPGGPFGQLEQLRLGAPACHLGDRPQCQAFGRLHRVGDHPSPHGAAPAAAPARWNRAELRRRTWAGPRSQVLARSRRRREAPVRPEVREVATFGRLAVSGSPITSDVSGISWGIPGTSVACQRV